MLPAKQAKRAHKEEGPETMTRKRELRKTMKQLDQEVEESQEDSEIKSYIEEKDDKTYKQHVD